jgi:hypothetical protein
MFLEYVGAWGEGRGQGVVGSHLGFQFFVDPDVGSGLVAEGGYFFVLIFGLVKQGFLLVVHSRVVAEGLLEASVFVEGVQLLGGRVVGGILPNLLGFRGYNRHNFQIKLIKIKQTI